MWCGNNICKVLKEIVKCDVINYSVVPYDWQLSVLDVQLEVIIILNLKWFIIHFSNSEWFLPFLYYFSVKWFITHRLVNVKLAVTHRASFRLLTHVLWVSILRRFSCILIPGQWDNRFDHSKSLRRIRIWNTTINTNDLN